MPQALQGFALVAALAAWLLSPPQGLTLPLSPNSVRFLVLGDSGTGARAQREVADQIVAYRAKFPFTFAIMLGDNMYGTERPHDYEHKFERPYRALLDANVEFHAALGNHDDPNQRFYRLFNLNGRRYAAFRKGHVRFFVLDSNYMDPEQIDWLERELRSEPAVWTVVYFHHPLYTAATRGPSLELRAVLEPLFVKHRVDVVFAGHEHLYERIKQQQGVRYFVAGGAAKLRRGDLTQSDETEAGFDRDRTFMLVEIAGNTLHFQTVSRTGITVDRGSFARVAR